VAKQQFKLAGDEIKKEFLLVFAVKAVFSITLLKIYPFLLPIEFCCVKMEDWRRLVRGLLRFEVGSAKTSPVWMALGPCSLCICLRKESPVQCISTHVHLCSL